jgi:hypothetical protein
MNEPTMRNIVAIAILASSVSAVAQTKPVAYSCSATRNTVSHSLDIKVDGDRLSDWSYLAATPAGDSSLTCSLDSTDGKETGSAAGVQTYVTDSGNVTVTKQGKSFVPLLNSQWVVWRVKGGRKPGAANP